MELAARLAAAVLVAGAEPATRKLEPRPGDEFEQHPGRAARQTELEHARGAVRRQCRGGGTPEAAAVAAAAVGVAGTQGGGSGEGEGSVNGGDPEAAGVDDSDDTAQVLAKLDAQMKALETYAADEFGLGDDAQAGERSKARKAAASAAAAAAAEGWEARILRDLREMQEQQLQHEQQQQQPA